VITRKSQKGRDGVITKQRVDFEDGTYTIVIMAGSSSSVQDLSTSGETVFQGSVTFSGGKGTVEIEE
jgi:hypothetical protein